jgi:hypothetical protein
MKGVRKTCRWVAGVILLLIPPVIAPAQTQDPARKAARALEVLDADYPEQKVYIHTDKQEYLAGETIWMKAYLVDARTHRLSGFERTLILEMYNSGGEAIASMLMKLEEGTAHGSVVLQDSLPGGNYLIRAYTSWMRNFGESTFFEKEILVRNPEEENFISRRNIRRNRDFNRDLAGLEAQVQFAFFPEGGHLVSGVESRVAFKAADRTGSGRGASGILFDGQGNEVLHFETVHNGMGSFTFTPRAGRRYHAEVRFENGSVKSLPLVVEPYGYVLRVENLGSEIEVRVKADPEWGNPGSQGNFYLFGHVRGKEVFSGEGVLENGEFRQRISLEGYPDGIIHITLFDSEGRPVAQRLSFAQAVQPVTPRADVRTGPSRNINYRYQMDLQLTLPQATGGSYSLAILGSDKPINMQDLNMETVLLLTSDIPSPVERPWTYFDPNNPQRLEHLDLLLLTQGWSRFDWQELFAGQFPEIRYGVAEGLTIRGRVSPASSRQPPGQTPVSLSVGQEGRKQLTTRSDAQGNFMFTGLDYTGTFTAEFIAGRDPAGRSLSIALETRLLEDIDYPVGPLTMPREALQRGDDWTRVPAPRTTLRSRQVQGQSSDRQSSIYGDPDQVIYMEDVREDYSTLAAVIRGRVTGLTETPSGFMLRGPSSFRASTEPLYIIDGTIAHPANFLNLNPREVERIEVLRGPRAAIFGVRGANGVLIAYTRLSLAGVQHRYEYTLYGYHDASEFYHSRIETEKILDNDVPVTQFWKPYVRPDEGGRISIRLPLNQIMPYNRMVLQGVDQDGKISVQDIPVRN